MLSKLVLVEACPSFFVAKQSLEMLDVGLVCSVLVPEHLRHVMVCSLLVLEQLLESLEVGCISTAL